MIKMNIEKELGSTDICIHTHSHACGLVIFIGLSELCIVLSSYTVQFFIHE